MCSGARTCQIDLICHVRTGNVNDIARLARLLRGTANTLVLSAGGARGFAHLGVIRALREAHVPIDLIGGKPGFGSCLILRSSPLVSFYRR